MGSVARDLGHAGCKIVELIVAVPAANDDLLAAVKHGQLTRAVP